MVLEIGVFPSARSPFLEEITITIAAGGLPSVGVLEHLRVGHDRRLNANFKWVINKLVQSGEAAPKSL